MKSDRVGRMLQIIFALQSGQNNSVDALARLFTLSRRTIYRDIKTLKKAGIPCFLDKKTRNYKVRPDFFLPALSLSKNEAASLLLLAYKGRDYINIPTKNTTLIAALKLENNLPVNIKDYCNKVLSFIHVKSTPRTDKESLGKKFAAFLEAILKKRIVKIRYNTTGGGSNDEAEFHPYHLYSENYKWYVIGKIITKNEIVSLNLDQIANLIISNKFFAEDKSFDIDEYLGKAWSVNREGILYHVKLKFTPEAGKDAAAVQWHNTQKVSYEKDGSVIIEFRVDGINEIVWWILSYGDQVRVISPKILRDRITSIARNILAYNKKPKSEEVLL